MKWYDQILNSVKSFFGLSTDATEQEIHQALQGYKSVEDFKAAVRAEIQTELQIEMQRKIDDQNEEFLKRKNDLQAEIDAANQKAADLQQETQQLRQQVEQLQAELLEKTQAFDALKVKAAAVEDLGRTGGDGASGSTMPIWEAWKSRIDAPRPF